MSASLKFEEVKFIGNKDVVRLSELSSFPSSVKLFILIYVIQLFKNKKSLPKTLNQLI